MCRLYSRLYFVCSCAGCIFDSFLNLVLQLCKIILYVYIVLCTCVIIVALYLRAKISIAHIHLYNYYGVQLRKHVQFFEIHLFSGNNHCNCDVVCYASKCGEIAFNVAIYFLSRLQHVHRQYGLEVNTVIVRVSS